MNLPESFLPLPGPGDASFFAPGARGTLLEREILPRHLAGARWFGGKARAQRRLVVRDIVPISSAAEAARLLFLEVEYEDGATDTYLLPLQIASGAAAETIAQTAPASVLARFADGALLFDALHDADFRAALFLLMTCGETVAGGEGQLAGRPGAAFAHEAAPASRVLGVEQSNSSIIYGDRVFLKLYRRLEEGENPDAEILRFLGGQNFPHVPPFAGAVEYRGAGGGTRVLALALGLVPNDGDAWSFTLRELAPYYECARAGDESGAAARRDEYGRAAAQLGARTGELHRALAVETADASFAPEPFTSADGAALAGTLQTALAQVRALLADRGAALDPATGALVTQFSDLEETLLVRAAAFAQLATPAAKTRTHGDYHLGQVLHGPDGFIIIDFEGEPLRPLAERRWKMSPFRDVAGMLRSFHYAAHAALEPLGGHRAALTAAAEKWAHGAQRAFLESWRAATQGAVFRDPDPAAERALLDAFLLEKALYEIRYEANNRPGWLGIPVRGVLALASSQV